MTTTEVVLTIYPLVMAAIIGGGALLLAKGLSRWDDRRELDLERRSGTIVPKR